jgi:hypothetical protein
MMEALLDMALGTAIGLLLLAAASNWFSKP